MSILRIEDADIPNATQEDLITAFRPWIYTVARRYRELLKKTGAFDTEDLAQIGCIALLRAQRNYDPKGGASFLSFSFNYLRTAMARELGFINDKQPILTVSLDDQAYQGDGDGPTLEETIPDTDSETPEEYAERMILYEQLHKAVNELDGPDYKKVIDLVYFKSTPKKEAAEALGMTYAALRRCEHRGLGMLRRNMLLRRLYAPHFSTSLGNFRRTFTSSVEAHLLWKEERESRSAGEDYLVEEPE